MGELEGWRLRAFRWARLATLLVVVSGACAASAEATTHALDGSCTLTGRLSFDRPVGLVPTEDTFDDDATGTCTGTLDGVGQQNTPVVWQATGAGTIGCLTTHTTSSGTLTFSALHARMHLLTDARAVLTQVAATFSGAVSGSGVAYVNLQGDPAACQAGTLTSVDETLLGRTITPVVG
jgi:hypothetical protein